MADKNAKAELNAEDLEGVAGGASVNVPNDPIGIRNHGIDILDDPLNVMPKPKDHGEKSGNLKDPRTWSMSEGESNNG